MFSNLHWLPADQSISYRIASLVWRCILGLAHFYLIELCCPLLSSLSLRSSQQGLLLTLFARTSTNQSRAFSLVGPSTWNGFPTELRIFPRVLSSAFCLNLRLLLAAVLELGVTLSSYLEEVVYKMLNTSYMLNLRATKGVVPIPLRFIRCHTFCFWNNILTF